MGYRSGSRFSAFLERRESSEPAQDFGAVGSEVEFSEEDLPF